MRVDELYKLWEEYMSEWVAGNEWLRKPYFYVLLGQLIHGYYYTGNRKSSWRTHLFSFQSSRSGKGQMMKATHFMFQFFNKNIKSGKGYKSIYLDRSVTPSWLSGGIEERYESGVGVSKAKATKKRVMVPGALQTYDFIAWGEGESVIKPDNTYGNISTLLRNALDEPGMVSLTARKDIDSSGVVPSYYTNASLCTGSIYNPELVTNSIINSGILQRFLITFKTFNGKEMIKLRKDIDKMETSAREWRSGDVGIRKQFMEEFFNKKYQKEVHFEPEISSDYSDYREGVEEKYMKGFYGLKFETMQAFLTANRLFDKKIAATICAYDGRKEIDLLDLKKAGEITIPTLEYAKDLLFKKFIPGGTKDENKRMNIILKIIGNEEIEQKTIMSLLKMKKNQNLWDLGHNNTLKYLNTLTKKGILKEIRRDRNKKFFRKI